jgi:hypothetical protein
MASTLPSTRAASRETHGVAGGCMGGPEPAPTTELHEQPLPGAGRIAQLCTDVYTAAERPNGAIIDGDLLVRWQ